MVFGHALAHAAHAADEDHGVALGCDGKFVHGLHAAGLVVFCVGVIHAMRPTEFAGYTNALGHVVGAIGITHAHNGVLWGFREGGFLDGLCHHLCLREPGVKLHDGAGIQELAWALVSFGGLKAHDALLLTVMVVVAELGEGGGRHGQHVVVALAFQIGNVGIGGDVLALKVLVRAVRLVLCAVGFFPDEERVAGDLGMRGTVSEIRAAQHLNA